MSLLEQDITRKRRVDEEVKQIEFDIGNNNGRYKVKAIWDSVVYTRESESGHLLGLYYLVSWKKYPKEKNTWELVSIVKHLRKLISLFYKDHSGKSTATFPAIDTISPMVRLTVKPVEPLK